jgi:hypothetical protein
MDIRRYQAKAQQKNREAAELRAQSIAGPEAGAGVEKERGRLVTFGVDICLCIGSSTETARFFRL